MPGRGTAVGVLVLRQEASMVDWRRAEGQQPGVHGREIGEGQVVRYWSWLLCPPPEDLPDPGTEPVSPAVAGGFLLLFHHGSPKQAITGVLQSAERSGAQNRQAGWRVGRPL